MVGAARSLAHTSRNRPAAWCGGGRWPAAPTSGPSVAPSGTAWARGGGGNSTQCSPAWAHRRQRCSCDRVRGRGALPVGRRPWGGRLLVQGARRRQDRERDLGRYLGAGSHGTLQAPPPLALLGTATAPPSGPNV